MVPVASWVRVWSIRSPISEPGTRSPVTRWAARIFWVMLWAIRRCLLKGEAPVEVGRKVFDDAEFETPYPGRAELDFGFETHLFVPRLVQFAGEEYAARRVLGIHETPNFALLGCLLGREIRHHGFEGRDGGRGVVRLSGFLFVDFVRVRHRVFTCGRKSSTEGWENS